MARMWWLAVVLVVAGCNITLNDVGRSLVLPEQQAIGYRSPTELPPAPLPESVAPRTVSNPQPKTTTWELSLDEAIKVALENARVIRVLAGTSAVASGRTIYDAAITNTTIDQEQARFDPTLTYNFTGNQTDTPAAALGLLDPERTGFLNSRLNDFRSEFALGQTNLLGGQAAVKWNNTPAWFESERVPLNPQNRSALEVSYTQPLLQGGGFQVNVAPIVIARLNTEQSFFQYKDSTQELVRGVIEGYWNLVQARVNVWARGIQTEQSKAAYDREQARFDNKITDVGAVAQPRVTYHQFQASKIAAEAEVLAREAALRNLLGLAPNDCRVIVPTSVPATQRLPHDWDSLVGLAEQRRPDIVELKIILQADHVRLGQAQNQALPKLDAVSLYRWNGLSGTMPNGEHLSSRPGQFTDWTVGVNFSVPLGLRQGRALVRQQELLIARDRANLDQGLHAAIHELAATLRDLDSAYDQYLVYKEMRAAAETNLRVQNGRYGTGQAIYLNVLQALNDWGNAVSLEAQQLLAYNVALATLERRTGTILETHGLIFAEERFRAAGPLPHLDREYPFAQPPVGCPKFYPGKGEPSENAFDLRNPAPREQKPAGAAEKLPAPKTR